MKNLNIKLVILLPFLLFTFITYGQNSYIEAIQMADSALINEQYRKAINMYDSAEAFDPSKRDVVRGKRGKVFDKIEALRAQAVKDKKQAIAQKKKAVKSEKKARKAEEKAQVALQKANKLVDAFYFYEGRFALAFKDNSFYFIDKTGAEVKKLGKWDKIEQFDGRGYAKVQKKEKWYFQDYLLDTLGNSYPVAYNLKSLNENITALDLSKKKLDKIPALIFENPQLKVLLLNKNNIINIPAEIGNLKNLTNLDLNENQLDSLPAEIGLLKELTALDLGSYSWSKSKNTITKIPAEFGELENLRELNLSFNQISSLFAEIGKLKNLTTLNLNSNQLNELPPEIESLKELRNLSLRKNQLSRLPSQISLLKNLTLLDVSWNQLNRLPREIRALKNLITLNLNGNPLDKLPSKFRELKKLKALYLYDTQFKKIPKALGKLKSLEDVAIGGNDLDLHAIEEALKLFPQLTKLRLGDLGLQSLPKGVLKLNNLQLLDFDNYLQKNPNTFTEEEKEKIKQLFPNCVILF